MVSVSLSPMLLIEMENQHRSSSGVLKCQENRCDKRYTEQGLWLLKLDPAYGANKKVCACIRY